MTSKSLSIISVSALVGILVPAAFDFSMNLLINSGLEAIEREKEQALNIATS